MRSPIFSCKSLLSATVAAVVVLTYSVAARAVVWDSVPGNGVVDDGSGLWDLTNVNWTNDGGLTNQAFFSGVDIATFGTAASTGGGVVTVTAPGIVANSLDFQESYTLTGDTLGLSSGLVNVATGKVAIVNNVLAMSPTTGLTVQGGGTIYLGSPVNAFAGNITVDGAGTTLLHRQEGPTNQYNGIGGAQEFGRFDQTSLGLSTAVKTITLQNGGTYRIIQAGNNPEGNYKNVIIGAGGGTLNLAPGYLVQNLDDVGQITATTNAFTKAGKGRLIITGGMATANPLGGVVNIDGGMLSLDNRTEQTVGGNLYFRFTGIAGTGTTVNINNGGTLFVNNGTQATFDAPIINANNGSIIAVNSSDHIFGFATATVGGPTVLTVSGTSTVLTRDLFNAQQQRLPRLRAELDGTGTLEIRGSTGAGNTPRLVIERSTAGSDFSGTFRLVENTSLEANPRFNASVAGGTGTVVDTGKVLAGGDIEFAGWGGTLDVRDSNPAAASVLDYTANEITITTTQAGNLNSISPVRATAATGTGHLFNFGTLTMGNHRLAIGGNNSYQTGFADTASIRGNAVLLMNSDNSPVVFSNAAAIAEDAAGRSLSLLKTGTGNTAARDVILGGSISLSNLNVVTGTLQLRGTAGAIGTAFGGAAATITVNGSGLPGNGATLPTAGLLHLDNNTGHVVGATTVIAAGNHSTNNRIDDTATLNLRGNSTLRMTSFNNTQSMETIGTTNVYGHGLIDIVKTGTPAAPVALTLNTLTLGTNATVNFAGTALGTAGTNTSRIVIPGTATGFLGAAYHQNNEWAKYDATVDNGFDIGVTPFVAGDYTTNPGEATWAAGMQAKLTSTLPVILSANRTLDRLNTQFTGVNSVYLNTWQLTLAQGGLITATNNMGFLDGGTGMPPSATAGVTAGTPGSPASLYVHATATAEFFTPIIDNGPNGPVTFVKSGTGTVILSHQDRAVNAGAGAFAPFTTATWSSTNTGGWVINDGVLNVHRGQFLGASPTTVTLNGGQLEINEPVSNANDATILPGWGHNIVVNGNAMLGFDDNGESNDGNTGDRTLVRLGSLTINNGSILGMASYSDNDIAFMNGATFNGRVSLSIGAAGRSGVNNANIISGELAGTGGFDVLALSGGSTLVLGGTKNDTADNTYNGNVTIYGATVRMNKANGKIAITDGAAAEDIIINGGTLVWGPGHHGDLATTNQVGGLINNVAYLGTNNGGLFGIAPTSPADIWLAGQNQIADNATITLLFGTLGEGDRFNNETFGSLIQKNGTFNVGLGAIVVSDATISGGAFNIDRGGSFTAGTLTLLPGAPDLNITTGIPAAALTVLEIGQGGLSMSGQNILLASGSSGNVAGAGAVLKLGGNVTHTGTDLIGGSYGRKGIFIQNANTFRQLGNSRIDLMGGTRDFNIDTDSIFTITPPMVNGGLSKSGGGALVLEPYQASSFTGPITVNAGILQAKGEGAFGTSAGGVTIANGATVKLDSSWTWGDDFNVTGPGALIPGGLGVREVGALVAVGGTSRLTGAVVLGGNATLAGDAFLDPSVAPGAGGLAFRTGTLRVESAGGVTGTGTLNLSGPGDGLIVNGVNTASGGVIKDGAGRWTIANASSYVGATTVSGGALRITNGAALGAVAAGTSVYGGGALELLGGIAVAEPLTLSGNGFSSQSGAVVNVGGANTLAAPITLLGATLRSDAGTLTVSNSITGGATALTLSGAGNGIVGGAITVGPPATGSVLTKTGTGTWTLAGANTLSGGTEVLGGTLALDYSTNNGAKLDAASTLTMRGGNLSILGSSTAPTAETVASLDLAAGGASIQVASSAAQSATLNLNAINRPIGNGATVDFTLPTNGAITTTTAPTFGILGGYATVGGQNWATTSGANVVALAAYTPLATAGATDNAELTASAALAGSATVNSLKISGSTAGLGLGANNLTLGSGGLLFTGTGNTGISGTGILSGFSPADELIVHTASGSLDIAAPIIGAGSGSLTKTGAGTLVLSGASAFTGPVNINGGTLLIAAAPAFPGPLGASVVGGNRLININGGAFGVLGDWDVNDWDGVTGGIQSLQFNIGSGGGTLQTGFGGNLTINDGSATPGVPTQLMGSGDLTLAGGGRYTLSGGTPQFLGFTGNVTVDGGILTVGHSNSVGGRQEQTITLKSGSAIINNTGFGLGQNGLPNNIVVPGGGVEFFALGGNRVYGGDIQLSGTNTIALFERDTLNQERQVYFNGRVTGTGVTLNVFGANNGNPFYLANGSNQITGTINLNPNAVLEVRSPGAVGMNDGDVTVNLATNARLLLRHWQNADYHANVVVNGHAEVNSDRLVNFGGGLQQFLTINNLTVNGDNTILTVGGGNNYYTRVKGTATLNGTTSNVLNVTASDLILENGLALGTPGSLLDKRGGFTAILRQPTNHTGTLVIQQGLIHLQDSGALPTTSTVELRGGELRVDNSNVALADRVNDAAAINLGGGVLRITGPETIGTVSAVAGVTQIVSNPVSETVPTPLTLTGFDPALNRAIGAIIQFQQPDLGSTAVGTATIGQARISSRILPAVAPALADTNQTIPGYVGNNAIDFIQYSTTLDSGFALGFRDMRNPGSGAAFATNYTDNAAETAWNDTVILRRTVSADNTAVTDTLTASRALDAIKIEAGGTNRDVTIALGAFNLRIDGGGILDVGNGTHDLNITGTTGVLTAGPATPGTSTAELVLGGTSGGSAFNIGAIIANNGTQPVAVVKVGTNTISLNGNNTFTGGLYVNSGTLNTTNPLFNGSTPGTIYLAGGTLLFNIANASSAVNLGVPAHAVNVLASSQINLDNGSLAGTDNDINFGPLTINGPYTLRLFSWDSMDATFTGTHTFTGTPTLDMTQGGSGGNQTGFFTINGAITGTGGFFVGNSGATDNTTSVLQIGGGEATPNTYTGKVTVLYGIASIGSFTEDLRVELNKAAGYDAITGDLEINGGVVRNIAANQIADTSNLIINWGAYDAYGKDETIASVTMRGGNFRTNSPAAAPVNTVTVLGDFEITGSDDVSGSVDGVAVNSQSILSINGTLKINGYGRGTVGGTNSTMILGGLEMTGTTLLENGAGSLIRLNGDVTTFASTNTARLGNTTAVGAQVQLNGTRTFNVADGPAGLDLSVSTALTDSTSPVAVGSLIKAGPGTMQLEGAATVNAYTGTTAVNEGTLILYKNSGVNAIPAGALTIGDGVGGASADKVILRNSNQIADGSNVTIDSSGLLDLETFNTSETIASLAGSGAVDLGPGSVLTVGGTTSATFAGTIRGAGGITKDGAGTWTLSGTNNYAGTTTVTAGILSLGSAGALESSTVISMNGGTLQFTAANTVDYTVGGRLKIEDGKTGIFDTNGQAVAFANPIALGPVQSGGLTKTGAGTLTLGAANAYTGTTTVSTDTLKLGNAAALGGVGLTARTADNGTTVASGATLDLSGQNNINEVIRISGTGAGGNGALVNTGGLASIGAASGSSVAAITSPTAGLNGPTISITGGGGAGATATANLGVTGTSFAIVSGTETYSVAPTVTISGGGGSGATATAVLDGSGLVTGITITAAGNGFSSAPSIAFSGGTILVAGTPPSGTGNDTNFSLLGLAITNPGSGFTSAPTVSFTTGAAPATLTASMAGVVLTGDSSIGGTGDITLNGIVSETGGARALAKVGSNTLTLANANTYTGATTVSGSGRLTVTGTVLTSSATVSATTATLELARSGGPATPVGLDVSNVGTLEIATAAQELGDISGTGTTDVKASAGLTANSIVQGSLIIGAGGSVTIRATPVAAGGAAGANAVPEPGTWVLIASALLGWLVFRRRR